MSATVLYMSMSFDGFIAGPNEGPGNGLGDGGDRLHDWALGGRTRVNGQVVDEFMATGAVVAGRGTFEPAGGWGGDHHDGVPIFVLTRRGPGIDTSRWPLVTYADDVTTAMTEAKRAAGDRDVLVHGAGTAQLALAAGVLDELEIHVIRSCSARDAGCSRTSQPSRSSSNARGSSRARAASLTCTTGSATSRRSSRRRPSG